MTPTRPWDAASIDACWTQPFPENLRELANAAQFGSRSEAAAELVTELTTEWRSIESRLGLRLGGLLPGGVGSLAFAGHLGGRQVVVKCHALPDECAREAVVLEVLREHRMAPKVHAVADRVIVLDKATPGTPLRSIGPLPSTVLQEVGELLGRLSAVQSPGGLPRIEDAALAELEEVQALIDSADPSHPGYVTINELDRTIVRCAEVQRNPPMLCHGDFQGGNVLRDDRGWIVIDPLGVIGDPAVDLARLVSAVAVADDRPAEDVLAIVGPAAGIPMVRVQPWLRGRAAQAALYLCLFNPAAVEEASGYRRVFEETLSWPDSY